MSSSSELPLSFAGTVVSGFQRGGKQLGCPTANMSDDVIERVGSRLDCGVYYGLGTLNGQMYDMVMSIGFNPQYKNEKKTVEVHLLHSFSNDFYGSRLECVVIGFLREMKKFAGIEELKQAIADDISDTRRKLVGVDRSKYKQQQAAQNAPHSSL